MHYSVSLGVAALSFKLVAGQQIECPGARRPNWNDCTELLLDANTFADGHENGAMTPGGEELPVPSCLWWFWEEGNCRIEHCWGHGNEKGDYRDTTTLRVLYSMVEDTCKPLTAGGINWQTPKPDGEFLSITNDEENGGGTPERRSVSVASLLPSAKETRLGNGLVKVGMSLEDNLAYHNATNELTAEKLKRYISDPLLKRQVEDDDVAYINIFAEAIRNEAQYVLGNRYSPGVDHEWTAEESTTFGITTSAEIGGAWSVFTASAGISVSQEDTYSVTESIKFNVNHCENQGQVTFWPYYNYYQVQFRPSLTVVDIWMPTPDGTGFTVTGEIAITCIG